MAKENLGEDNFPSASEDGSVIETKAKAAAARFEEVDDSLEELILVERGLSCIPAVDAEKYGGHATMLNLAENKLTSSENMEKFEYLETLVLDKNGLRDLSWMCPIATLRTLYVNNNNVTDLPAFIDQVKELFPNLEYLSMMRNPCCPCFWNIVENEKEDEQAEYRRHRLYVLYRLPRLSFLDATPVTSEERDNALKRGKYLGRRATPKKRASSTTPPPTENPSTPVSQKIDTKSVLRRSSTGTSRKSQSFLGIEEGERYDGTNSEGNRFITNTDL